jgi:hypothetical protein
MTMDDKSISAVLRDLSSDFYQNHICFEDYRLQRKEILDNIDYQMNGKKKKEVVEDDDSKSSLFMQTITFLQNQDDE